MLVRKRSGVALFLALLTLLIFVPHTGPMAVSDERPVPIRVGWQMPAVTQAALVQVLKRTDVMARHGLEPNLVPFSYGTPQIEAALAGELDVLFAGDQPVINLLAYGGKWKIVARAFYDRIAIIVPPNSPIREMDDLRGATVASAFGSVGHREVLLAQQAAGLDVERDVTNRDLDILEIRRRVLEGGVESWGRRRRRRRLGTERVEFRTLGTYAQPLRDTHARCGRHVRRLHRPKPRGCGSVPRRTHPRVALPRAGPRARDAVVQRRYPVRLRIRRTIVAAVGMDPNVNATSLRDIDIGLDEQHVAILEKNTAWGSVAWEGDNWGDGSRIRHFVDQDLLGRAMEAVATTPFEDLRVILPSIRAVESIKTDAGYGLDAIPLWVVFTIMVGVALAAIELGLRMGRRAQGEVTRESSRPIATVGAAVLGLMAFVIALNFGSATSRFDARKAALLDDVAAIQTAYLRTSMLPEPHRTTVRSLLRDYVQARAGMVYAYGEPGTLQLVETHARTLQALMWDHVERMAEDNSGAYEPFAAALNDMFNLHTRRVVLGAYYRIPGFMWWAIIFASAVAMMAVGFQFGVAGGRRVLPAKLALALTFALVMMLAFDIDRAGAGLISVNQKPMINLYQSMSSQR